MARSRHSDVGTHLVPRQDDKMPPGYAPVHYEEDDEIDLQHTWNLLRRNRWVILGSVVFGLIAGYLYISRQVPVYRATATLRIEEPPTTGALPQGARIAAQNPTELETEMAVLQSRSIALIVVDSLDLQATIQHPPAVRRHQVFSDVHIHEEEAALGTWIFEKRGNGKFVVRRSTGPVVATARVGESVQVGGWSFTLSPKASLDSNLRISVVPRHLAAEGVRRGTRVARASQTQNIVRVEHEHSDPVLAARVANTLANAFVAQRKREQKSAASSMVDFLNVQIDTISTQLATAEEKLREFREREKLVDLEAEGSSTIDQLAHLKGRRDAVRAERTAIGEVLQKIEDTGRPEPFEASPARRLFGMPALVDAPGTSNLLSHLIELERERDALLERRTPQDDQVQAINQRIAKTDEQILEIASVYHQILRSEENSLGQAIDRAGGTLGQIPRKQVGHIRLQRQADLLQDIYTLLQTRLKEAEISEANEDPNVRVLDAALVPSRPISPATGRNLLLAAILGLALGVGVAFGRERLDRSIHSMDELEILIDVPALGVIPSIARLSENQGTLRKLLPGRSSGENGSNSANLMMHSWGEPTDPVAEAFRSLRTNITFSTADRVLRTMLITSPSPGDGKTTITLNMAVAFARQGERVLVIDGDMRRGNLHHIFGVPRSPGFADLLAGSTEDAIHQVIVGSESLSCDFIPAGQLPPNPAELLGAESGELLLTRLQERYDTILIDSPPLTLVTDAAVLSSRMDAVYLVVRAGHTNDVAVEFAMRQLHHVNAPIHGAILNDLSPRDRYYGSYGYYAYGYGSYAPVQER